MYLKYTLLLLVFLCPFVQGLAQPKVNYNEEAIKPYTIPELLIAENGQKIQRTADWESIRREEILDLFKTEVYGHLPKTDLTPTIKVIEESKTALQNRAVRKQIEITFEQDEKRLPIQVLLYLPKKTDQPPIFVGYNFYGNHTITDDPHVKLTNAWLRNKEEYGITENKATEFSRGKRAYRWAIEHIIDEGFGLAVVYCGDVDPDKNDFTDGIQPFFYENGQEKPNKSEWGTISAWAWGLSKVLDVLKADKSLADSKFIAFGHSRLGKTSLWAGALDERFDMVVSNNSGCGGAALFRRKYGETAAIINQNFPHWFTENFKKYSHNETSLPVDQHQLIALIAPRPVYIASAKKDKWADPYGEYLAAYHASPVYELYGKKGLPSPNLPQVNEPIHHTIGYHIRTGGHDVTDYDWTQFMKFAKQHFNLP